VGYESRQRRGTWPNGGRSAKAIHARRQALIRAVVTALRSLCGLHCEGELTSVIRRHTISIPRLPLSAARARDDASFDSFDIRGWRPLVTGGTAVRGAGDVSHLGTVSPRLLPLVCQAPGTLEGWRSPHPADLLAAGTVHIQVPSKRHCKLTLHSGRQPNRRPHHQDSRSRRWLATSWFEEVPGKPKDRISPSRRGKTMTIMLIVVSPSARAETQHQPALLSWSSPGIHDCSCLIQRRRARSRTDIVTAWPQHPTMPPFLHHGGCVGDVSLGGFHLVVTLATLGT
jgi:hypothetical protein